MIHRAAFVGLVLCAACDQSTLVGLPDSSDLDACVAHAVPFCDASATGCVGGGGPNGSLLPADAAFPVGCTANVIGTKQDPMSGRCELAAVCTCTDDAGSDAASPVWICSP